jgi:predicted transcriptional regulator
MAKRFKITLLRGTPPPVDPQADINKELQWFCTSLGLVGNRDKNLSTFRIFITLLRARQKDKMLSSDFIANETSLTRATVIHHLNKLASSGIVHEDHERYRLTVDSMEDLVRRLSKEIEESMRDLEQVSKRIDERLGLR